MITVLIKSFNFRIFYSFTIILYFVFLSCCWDDDKTFNRKSLTKTGLKMIYEMFSREVKTKRDEFSIVYYLEMKRNIVNVIYEYTGLYMYDYRRYSIKLNYSIRNEYVILENILKNVEKVYNNFSETRKLAVVAKYVIYVVSTNLNVPLYKSIKSIIYEANGEITELSVNAFVKGIYRLIPKFEKILS